MKHIPPLLAVLALATVAGFAAVAAQDTDPKLDLEQVRARASEFTEDAEALATSVRNRAETLVDDARTTRSEAQANRDAYVENVGTNATGEVLDFDTMVREQAAAELGELGTSPRFIAFASLSMPDASFKALVQDMARAGGVTVLRGFPEGNADVFKRRLASIWSDGSDTGSVGIDPRLFRAFAVEAAPSFVMLGGDFSPCDGFDCTSNVPPHDRIGGNVSVAYVLETFAGGGGPGASAARHHLTQLEGARP